MTGARYDAIVIGASLGGLVAAALLARSGHHVVLLERQVMPPEPIGPLYALDPMLVPQLHLMENGLRFIHRDLPLAIAGHAGPSLMLPRDVHDAERGLLGFSSADAKAWAPFQDEVQDLARRLRRWWWSGMGVGAPDWVLERPVAARAFERLSLTGADAFLAAHFESDALMAGLLFDASAGGFHVSEPGSALALVWRAAQEMGGLQGAATVPAPGTLIWSLIKAAGAADFRCCATVAAVLTSGGAVQGVRLANGEVIFASRIFSSLDEDVTAQLCGLPAQKIAGAVGQVRLLLSLRQPVSFPAQRLVVADQAALYMDAHEMARRGKLAADIPMEMTAAGPSAIAVTIRPVPALLSAEDRIQLAARAVRHLSRQIPGAASLIADVRFAHVAARRASLEQLLAPPARKVKGSLRGLYMCGDAAEPLPCLSGRAARLAVQLAAAEFQK